MTILLAIWIACAGIGITGIVLDKPITKEVKPFETSIKQNYYYQKKGYKVITKKTLILD